MKTITVINMEVIPSLDGMTDIVKNILFQVTDEVLINGVSYQIIGGDVVSLPIPNPSNFTPYDSLTESEVVEWIEENYNVDALVERLTVNLQQQVAPVLVPMTPPWE